MMGFEKAEAMNIDFTESEILSMKSVQLAAAFNHKNDAIYAAAELLVQVGAVDRCYLDSMLAREEITNTWLGNGIAIPHGLVENCDLIIKDAVAVIQVPAGVEWQDGKKAYLIIAIAACPDRYREICRKLTSLLFDKNNLKYLRQLRTNGKLLQLYFIRI